MRYALDESDVPHKLHVAKDGRQALMYLRQQGPLAQAPRPDLVILDLNVPYVSGREVLQQMKMNPSLAAIPVVVLSGSKALGDVVNSYESNASAYLTKPTDLPEYTELVRAMFDFWLKRAKLPPV